MSIIKTTRVWNGLPVEEYTNVSTGVIELRSLSFLGIQGDLLATGDNTGRWSYNNQERFLFIYNNRQRTQGRPALTQSEFNRRFFTEGTRLFNNDRANVLNTETNYETYEIFENNTAAYATTGVPGVRNPEDGTVNNSEGSSVSDTSNNDDEAEDLGVEQGGSGTSNSSSNRRADPFTTSHYRYPSGQLPNLDYDFIQFRAFTYEAGGSENLTTRGEIDPRLGSPTETITLPMIPAISESNKVGWGGKELNELQAAAARIAGNAIKAGDGFNIGAAAKELVDSTQKEANAILTQNPGLKDAIVAYFAGQAAGVGGALLTRSTGAVLNPNLELLFEGPSLRQFSFNFKFRPRDSGEAQMIRSIIRAFKRNMAVQRRSGELFLYTPNIFKIKYLHKGGDHPFMNRLMPCACTSFNVVYTPDNNYMTYADGSMTGYDVEFTMAEIAPIFADHQAEAGGTGF